MNLYVCILECVRKLNRIIKILYFWLLVGGDECICLLKLLANR